MVVSLKGAKGFPHLNTIPAKLKATMDKQKHFYRSSTLQLFQPHIHSLPTVPKAKSRNCYKPQLAPIFIYEAAPMGSEGFGNAKKKCALSSSYL